MIVIEKFIYTSIETIDMKKGRKLTSIQISEETKIKLAKLGQKGDSYEDIIIKLMKK